MRYTEAQKLLESLGFYWGSGREGGHEPTEAALFKGAQAELCGHCPGTLLTLAAGQPGQLDPPFLPASAFLPPRGVFLQGPHIFRSNPAVTLEATNKFLGQIKLPAN